MAKGRRPYKALQKIIERHNGKMTYQRNGYRYGAWIISQGEKVAIIEAMGNKSFPALDTLFVPRVEFPKTWADYGPALVEGAEAKFLALLK